jgi:hypothetical protein
MTEILEGKGSRFAFVATKGMMKNRSRLSRRKKLCFPCSWVRVQG